MEEEEPEEYEEVVCEKCGYAGWRVIINMNTGMLEYLECTNPPCEAKLYNSGVPVEFVGAQ